MLDTSVFKFATCGTIAFGVVLNSVCDMYVYM